MTRPLWPPLYANIDVAVIRNKDLPNAAFRLYCDLRALAWGEQTLTIDEQVLLRETGLSRSRLYEYARTLRLCGALLWRHSDNSFECSFVGVDDESRNPGKRDLPSNQSIPKESVEKKPKTRKIPESRKAGLPEPKAKTREITDEYCLLLGYKPDNWAEGEAAAGKKIGEKWTVEEFREAYKHYKAQTFWAGKRLTLRHLVNEIPEYFQAKSEGKLNGNNRTNGKASRFDAGIKHTLAPASIIPNDWKPGQ